MSSCDAPATSGFYISYSCGLTEIPYNIPEATMDVRLYDNKITVVRSQPLEKLTQLQELKLNNNSISRIETGAFAPMTQLRELWLHRNQLTNIQKTLFETLTSLEVLRLHTNKIRYIQAGTFRNLGELRKLYLGFNELSTIRAGTLEGLEKLEILGLSNNQIDYLAAGAFSHMPQLQTLKLASNDLMKNNASLSADIFGLTNDGKFEMNLTLDITGNPLQCDSRLGWMGRLQTEGSITWIDNKKPDCANYPDTDWDQVLSIISPTGKQTLYRSNSFRFCSAEMSVQCGICLPFKISNTLGKSIGRSSKINTPGNIREATSETASEPTKILIQISESVLLAAVTV